MVAGDYSAHFVGLQDMKKERGLLKGDEDGEGTGNYGDEMSKMNCRNPARTTEKP